MTVFDLDYAKLLESKRSNRANEALKEESNSISRETNSIRMSELDETISHNNAKELQMSHQNKLIDAQTAEAKLKGHKAYWEGENARVKALPYTTVYDSSAGDFFIIADYAVPAFDRAYDATVGNIADTYANIKGVNIKQQQVNLRNATTPQTVNGKHYTGKAGWRTKN